LKVLLIEELRKDILIKRLKEVISEARRDLDLVRTARGPPPHVSNCLRCRQVIDDAEMDELRASLDRAVDAAEVGCEAAREASDAYDIEAEAMYGLKDGSPVKRMRVKGLKVMQQKANARKLDAQALGDEVSFIEELIKDVRCNRYKSIIDEASEELEKLKALTLTLTLI